ncbi:MAG TPA: UDP-2,3-diacylglucosamine diphosphatase LpxI [Candidatus Enterousia avicola]|uniref:UDP-2,3-diacylglucosamine diphosphatase LpxI n=1 Tax=Candidatus Enterousia avicola TaxID=2840787 RepID=A0A9D1MRY5_9PROT|nr:UDP-2,3-diacylglucosamine diphosphatase LpxI [Candidatus Enterousia avicola]
MKKNNKEKDKKIAVIAGALDLPFFTRDALRKAGWSVFVIGLKNFYDPRLQPDMVMRIGGAWPAVREARRRGIKKLTFVGSLGHPNLSDVRPDLWSIGLLLSILKNQRGYDSMAVALNKALEKRGFEIVAAQDVAPELTFQKAGVKTKVKPTAKDKKDIDRAIEVSHTIGAADIGASVVVDRQVIAVEAAEGTARMLDRVIDMRKGHKGISGVFAKMTKPGQDLRIDIPAIGVDTVNSVAAAKLRGIIVNTKTCFVVDKEAVIKRANEKKIFIVAVD